jgi:transcriptional regulator with XRE-family HTH domain
MWLDRLIAIKKKSGKTLNDISAASGVPLGTLNKLFAGQTEDPKLGTVRAVVHALGYTLDDLDDTVQSTRKFSDYNFTKDEIDLILAYRCASPDDKTIVQAALRKYSQIEQEKTVSAG